MLGILEQTRPTNELSLMLGLRYALFSLAVLAALAAIRDIIGWLKLITEDWPISKWAFIAHYINRLVLAFGVIISMPSAMYRLGKVEVSPEVAFHSHMLSVAFVCVYFLNDELVRLLTNGSTLKSALLHCIPIGVGVALLLMIGINSDVRL